MITTARPNESWSLEKLERYAFDRASDALLLSPNRD